MDTATASAASRLLLERLQDEGRIIELYDDLPRAAVLCETLGETLYLQAFSAGHSAPLVLRCGGCLRRKYIFDERIYVHTRISSYEKFRPMVETFLSAGLVRDNTRLFGEFRWNLFMGMDLCFVPNFWKGNLTICEEIEIKDEVLDLKVTDKYDENDSKPRRLRGPFLQFGQHRFTSISRSAPSGEIVDNSIDEALAGYCTHIEVTIERAISSALPTTAAAFPAVFTRRWAFRRSRLCSPSCTQAASSTAPATRYPAVCTALVHRS